MCLALPAQERCAILPVPERWNWAQWGFGHEHRVYLSGAGVVRIIAVLLWQGMDHKIQSRRQLCHVTLLQDYHLFIDRVIESLAHFAVCEGGLLRVQTYVEEVQERLCQIHIALITWVLP